MIWDGIIRKKKFPTLEEATDLLMKKGFSAEYSEKLILSLESEFFLTYNLIDYDSVSDLKQSMNDYLIRNLLIYAGINF